MADVQASLSQYMSEIETTLQSALAEFTQPSWLYDPVHYLLASGGKRVRPLLTLLACEACGGRRHHALPAAVAVELLHNFTLVHDDIMDRSPMRRGRSTVHVRWGDSAAILSGDVLMGIAMRLLERSARHASRPLDVLSAFSTGLIDVCDGQALDLAFTERQDVSEEAYFEMITKKTAKLLEMSVTIGAAMADAASDADEALRAFARDIGVAFQLQDDLLDLYGTEAFGKTPGGDLVEGKRTWLMIAARDAVIHGRATADDATLVEAFHTNNGIAVDHVPAAVAMLERLGITSQARSMVEARTASAFAHLDTLPPSAARDSLAHLAALLMARTA